MCAIALNPSALRSRLLGAPNFRKAFDVSFSVLTDEYAQALWLQQTRNFIMLAMVQARPVIVLTPSKKDVQPLLRELRGFMIEVEHVDLHLQQVLCCDVSERFVRDQLHVLVVSLHPDNVGITSPMIQNLSPDVALVGYRLHESDKTRDSFHRWLDLFGRMSKLPRVAKLHTFVESERNLDLDVICKWMKDVRDKVPEELLNPIFPANIAKTTKTNIVVANK